MSRKTKIIFTALIILVLAFIAFYTYEKVYAPTNGQPDIGTNPNPNPNPAPTTGNLTGHVDIGPFCPVQRQGQDCPVPSGTYEKVKILLYASDATTLLNTLDVDSSGNFGAVLAPGDYAIDYKWTSNLYPHAPEAIVIKAGETHEVDFTIDTGIR